MPSNVVARVVPVLIETGRYPHPTLGLIMAELGTEVTVSNVDVAQGLLITQIDPGSPAEQAGLQAAQATYDQFGRVLLNGGDIITAVDDRPVARRNDLLILLDKNYRPGDTIALTIYRGGQPMQISFTLGGA